MDDNRLTKMINGKAVSLELSDQIAAAVKVLNQNHGIRSGLAVVLVGDNSASDLYVRNKVRQCEKSGIVSYEYRMSGETSQDELLTKIDELNKNTEINGILVQLPLPSHIEETAIINAIDPVKDVDGFHAENSGRLLNGQTGGLIPCTPQGCVILIKKHLGGCLSGKEAVVIGRSNIVGKPVALLLLQENCTVTLVHSKTKNLRHHCRTADIVVAAAGVPEMVKSDWIKPGATVIDVGINHITDQDDGKSRLVGDVDFDDVAEYAGGITPVPGGVGPMTIACLLYNTAIATCRQNDIDESILSDRMGSILSNEH